MRLFEINRVWDDVVSKKGRYRYVIDIKASSWAASSFELLHRTIAATRSEEIS